MFTSEKISEIEKNALISWKDNLDHEVKVLKAEMEDYRIKEIELRTKYNVAYNAYSRFMDEEVEKYVYGPLKEEIEEFRSVMNHVIEENKRKIEAIGSVLLSLEEKINSHQ